MITILDQATLKEVKDYLSAMPEPVTLTASLDSFLPSVQLWVFLQEIATQTDKIILSDQGNANRKPSVQISNANAEIKIQFACVPLGHELSSFILAILQVSGAASPKISGDLLQLIQAIQTPLYFETYVSLSCQACPEISQTLNTFALLNPKIAHTTIDGALFTKEVADKNIMAVPAVFLNGEPFIQGRVPPEDIINKLNPEYLSKSVERINQQQAFDVLSVGGGPSGVIAALKAAGKGQRAAIVTTHFNPHVAKATPPVAYPGQSVHDPLDANVFTPATECSPYKNIEIFNLQTAQTLIPAQEPDGLHTLICASGARLQAKQLIIATGARWQTLNIPGEVEYKHKGIAYNPHCDGPLYQGEKIAIIGSTQSAIDAAKYLSGIASDVFILERAPELNIDQEQEQQLAQYSNIHTQCQVNVVEITGEGKQVNGLYCVDLQSNEKYHLPVACIFILTGLTPNSEWLDGVLELNGAGEVIVDAQGQTAIPGIYATGDIIATPDGRERTLYCDVIGI